jgi:hypothetical protein
MINVLLIFSPMLKKFQINGHSPYKALLSAGLLGGAAMVVITALVAPAKANNHEPGFGSAITFLWKLEESLNVTYSPTIDIEGVSVGPGVSIDISLRTRDATNLKLIGSISKDVDDGKVGAQFNIPISNYRSDSASWDLGYILPINKDGVMGEIEFKTTGPFSKGALSAAASNARIGIKLGLLDGFGLDAEFGFSERDDFGIKKLSIGQNLSLGDSSFMLGIHAPIDFYLRNGSAGEPPPPPLDPPIHDLLFIEPIGFFHTPGTGYVYTGRGKLGPTQEFGLVSSNISNVPGPIPILGIGVALSFSRKLRKRIKNAKPKVISTTAI